MGQFCNKCGAPLNGAKFCTKCGAPAGRDKLSDTTGMTAGKTLKPRNMRIKLFVILAMIVAIIAVLVIMFGGRIYKKITNQHIEALIDEYVNSIIDNNPDEAISLIHDDMVDCVVEEEYDGDRAEMIKDLGEFFDGMFDAVDDAVADLKIEYEIVGEDDYSDKEIENLVDEWKERDIDLNIKDAKYVELDIKYESINGHRGGVSSIGLTLVKIGGSWYIIPL